MIYRTLHAYILRELLRVFLLTASALTTLLAFGGTFRPFTRQGIDISQLMVILMNLMPAMLAYAIPIAALFAAVLVYWRMSTDNEITACRAGGISFQAMILPALVLGIVIASVDLVFVNYVVPKFLQAEERAVMRDLGSLMVGQITRQERFQFDRIAVSADAAELVPSDEPNTSHVKLTGMVATVLEPAEKSAPPSVPAAIILSRQTDVTIHNMPDEDAAEISFKAIDGFAFNPYFDNEKKKFDPASGFRSGQTGTLDSALLDGRPIPVPSYFRSKVKYLNEHDLEKYYADPFLFPAVAKPLSRVEAAYKYQRIGVNMNSLWQAARKASQPLRLHQPNAPGSQPNSDLVIDASQLVTGTKNASEPLQFKSDPGQVRIEQQVNGITQTTYTCDAVTLALNTDEVNDSDITSLVRLSGNIHRENPNGKPAPVTGPLSFDVLLDPAVKNVPPVADKKDLLTFGVNPSGAESTKKAAIDAATEMNRLFLTITSERHSRGSFALSCLMLVLFGAALGILLRGKNPLAVFVLGFVPAIILVLLITAGRQLAEASNKTDKAGIALIWAGNGLLLVLVAGVYAKLLRR